MLVPSTLVARFAFTSVIGTLPCGMPDQSARLDPDADRGRATAGTTLAAISWDGTSVPTQRTVFC